MKLNKGQLLVFSYVTAILCFVLGLQMIISLSIEGGVLAVLLFRQVFLYPVLLCSYLIVILSITWLLRNMANHAQWRTKLKTLILFTISAFSALFCHYFLIHHSFLYHRIQCSYSLDALHRALLDYKLDHGMYPPADQWCDALEQNIKSRTVGSPTYLWFKCPGGNEGRSNFALNPNVKVSSPDNVVWVFDSYIGWNTNGGKELLNPGNHEDKGCNVMFHNGQVMFVKKSMLCELKWE